MYYFTTTAGQSITSITRNGVLPVFAGFDVATFFTTTSAGVLSLTLSVAVNLATTRSQHSFTITV